MIILIILTGSLTAAFALWLLATRADPSFRLYLAVIIPIVLTWPFVVYQYGSSLLGYSIAAPLPANFRLVYAYADDKAHTIYALLVAPGEAAPRLYAITANYEKNKQQFAQAQAASGRGMPMAGTPKKGSRSGQVKATGISDEGDFIFYQLPPTGVPNKETGQ